MDQIGEYFITLLAQFSGGPGPAENNLVRFGLAAIFWGALLLFVWNKQRRNPSPRERWLVVGFGLAFVRDLFMFVHLSQRLITGTEHDALCSVTVPMEHMLTLFSMVVIGGAFLRYILDDADLARNYLTAGLALSVGASAAVFGWWPRQLRADPSIRFHATWMAYLLHLLAAILIAAAIVLLVRKRGWLRNVVVLALSMILVSECLVLLNLTTERLYSFIICPLGNALYIWSIPVFGYVYYREQVHEKRQTEAALDVYRNQLEKLVEERTAALTAANNRLQREIVERVQTEEENARLYEKTQRWAAGMAALHAMSIELSSTLDLAAIDELIVQQATRLTDSSTGLLYRWDERHQSARLVASCADSSSDNPGPAEPPAALTILPGAIRAELAMRRPFLVAQEEQCPCTAEEWRALADGQALLCAPLCTSQAPGSFLFLTGADGRAALHADDIDLLENYTGQAAAALENAFLHQQLERAATLEERQRIAAEMHDGLAQTLSYLGLTTDRAAGMLEQGNVAPVLEEFERIQSIIERATQDIRRSIASLQSAPEPRRALGDALALVVDAANRTGGAPVRLADPARAGAIFLSTEELEQITRVVAEALTNARRHAAASRIAVSVARRGKEMNVTVADDGRGFSPDPQAASQAGHFGLNIMQARAARMGGRLAIDAAPGAGTRITLTWQVAEEATGTKASFPVTEQAEIEGVAP
jgi:signal transduction histidine kinase